MGCVSGQALATMTAGTLVRLTKLSTDAAPRGPILPEGYWLEGTLSADLELSRPIQVFRTRRMGRFENEPPVVEIVGMFESTDVVLLQPEADGSVVATTENSHWRISPLT